MNKVAGFLVGTLGLALGIFWEGASAATECNAPPPGPPMSGTFLDGVVVNGGDFCRLAGAHVAGGVRVNEGGILILCGSHINDGLVSNGAANLIIGAEEINCAGNLINGGVQISNTGPGALSPAPSIALELNAINGAVRLTGNQGDRIAVANNTINGSLICVNNASNLDDEGTPSIVKGAVRCTFGEGE